MSPMSMQDHIVALKQKHATLDSALERENLRPHPDEVVIHDLKREKLKIKDEIANLSEAAVGSH